MLVYTFILILCSCHHCTFPFLMQKNFHLEFLMTKRYSISWEKNCYESFISRRGQQTGHNGVLFYGFPFESLQIRTFIPSFIYSWFIKLLFFYTQTQNPEWYKYTLFSVNDVPGKDALERPPGVFPASVGAIHLERPLKNCKLAFEGLFPGELPPQKLERAPQMPIYSF